MAGGSGAATKACRTATSLSDRETGWGGRKAQVNTAALRPMWASGSYSQRAGWRGPRRYRERKSSIQHIQICPRHRREGWARQKASSSSCLAGRWRESSLSFQRCGSDGPQRYTDPQVVPQVSGQGGWSTGCSNPQREGKRTEDHCREERPVAALMLLSAVGYLQGEKASTVVTPRGSLCYSTPDPTAAGFYLKK